MNEKHAVYALAYDRSGALVPFRLGLPVDWNTAIRRHTRLSWDDPRPRFIKWNRRKYRIRFYEVRAVDGHGRGLGSLRHGLAFPVPFRAARLVK